jgi:hypothetical protein
MAYETAITQKNQQIDTFVCVHHSDVGELLEWVLRAYELNFQPKGRLILISNDPSKLQDFVATTGVATDAVISADGDWLSKSEMELPGWYRQQLIKLRAYEFCETENFCNLGADTVMLQPITTEDMIDVNGFPVLYYTQHRFPDQHVRFERERVTNVARILQTEPTRAAQYVDFINDLFCFNRTALQDLQTYLETLYGQNPYQQILRNLDSASVSGNQFGEWTLYSTYLLDVLKKDVTLRNTRPDFLYQVHGKLNMLAYRYNTKIVHFVGKAFDAEQIRRKLDRQMPVTQ